MKYFIMAVLSVFAGVILCHECNKIPSDSVLVKKSWLDSLNKIASLPPEIVRDTIFEIDTLKIPYPVHVDKNPVFFEADTTDYLDTLKSPYFDVFLHDRFYNNALQKRFFTYDVFIPETAITETITEKVPFPYEVELYRPKLYGGVNIGNAISADISYRVNNSFYGIGYGNFAGNSYFYIRYQFVIR